MWRKIAETRIIYMMMGLATQPIKTDLKVQYIYEVGDTADKKDQKVQYDEVGNTADNTDQKVQYDEVGDTADKTDRKVQYI